MPFDVNVCAVGDEDADSRLYGFSRCRPGLASVMKSREAVVVCMVDVGTLAEEVLQNWTAVLRPGCCMKWCAPGSAGEVNREQAKEELEKREVTPFRGPVEGVLAALGGNGVVVHGWC